MGRTCRFFVFLALAVVISSGVAWAEEIIYFTNGTSMPIRSHEVRGDMIHVDLGEEAFLAFPMRMVEKVEQAGREVALKPSFSGGNRRAGPRVAPNDGNFPVQGQEPSRFSDSKHKLPRQRAAEDPNIDMDDSGVAVYRPHAGSTGARGRLGAAGHQRALGAQREGGSKYGNRTVIGSNAPSNLPASRKPPVGMQQIPRKPRPSGSDSAGSGSGGSDSGSSSSSGSGD